MQNSTHIPSGPGEVYYTLPEVCTILRIHRSSLTRIRKRKELKTCHFGGSVRVSKTVLDKYIADHTQQ